MAPPFLSSRSDLFVRPLPRGTVLGGLHKNACYRVSGRNCFDSPKFKFTTTSQPFGHLVIIVRLLTRLCRELAARPLARSHPPVPPVARLAWPWRACPASPRVSARGNLDCGVVGPSSRDQPVRGRKRCTTEFESEDKTRVRFPPLASEGHTQPAIQQPALMKTAFAAIGGRLLEQRQQ